MSTSKVGICNIALASLGADSIRALDESNKRAHMCNIFFDVIRKFLLTKLDWPFARVYATLQLKSGVEAPEGWFAYGLPADCLAPRDIMPEGSRTKWQVAGQNILCMIPGDQPVVLKYTYDCIDPNQFSDSFVQLTALGIAYSIAPSITQDKQLTAAIYEQYKIGQSDIFEADANFDNEYRAHDETPENDTFVSPDGFVDVRPQNWRY